MRIIVLVFLFSLKLTLVNAQERKAIELQYLSKNFLDFDVEGIDKLYLFDNNSKSLYIVGDKEDIKETSKKVKADIVLKIPSLEDEYYFQDKKQDTLYFKDVIIQDAFYVKEKTPKFIWLLANEYKEIQGKKIQKATTTFRGRTYTAWCDLENPISVGPWKFNNLPGLAYSIIDETPHFYYEWHLLQMIEIDFEKIPVLEKEPQKYIGIKEFIIERAKVYEKFEERNRARTVNVPGLEEISSDSKSIDRKIRANEIKYEWEE